MKNKEKADRAENTDDLNEAKTDKGDKRMVDNELHVLVHLV